MTDTGTVWLVGAGPGDPGLVTVRGLEVLAEADAVVYDRLVPEALLAHAPVGAELHYVGKQRGHQVLSQTEINALLVRLAQQGLRVVRLKGGDPFVFGRGGEEALALHRAGVHWEVVPGVSSAIAAAAFAGIPVTHRRLASSFAVVSGHVGLSQGGITSADTLVVLMAVQQLGQVVASLIERGRSTETPTALIHAASTPRQQTVIATLGTIVAAAHECGLGPPATLVIGPTVSLAADLAQVQRRPLLGRSILVGRTRSEPSALARMFTGAGANVTELPRFRVVPPVEPALTIVQAALRELSEGGFAGVVFGGADSVVATWARLAEIGFDSRAMRARVYAYGPGTTDALAQRGIQADWAAPGYLAADIADGIAERAIRGAHLLLPTLEIAERLCAVLRDKGVYPVEIGVARLEPDEPENTVRLAALLSPARLDLAVLPASRAVDSFADLLSDANRELEADTRVLCIGQRTAARARQRGLRVDAIAEESSREGLVRAAIELLGNRPASSGTQAGAAFDE